MNTHSTQKLFLLICLLILPIMGFNRLNAAYWEYHQDEGYPKVSMNQCVQLRVGSDFTKKFGNGIQLGISEELRFNMFSTLPSAYSWNDAGSGFDKSYTTLSFSYSPINYVKLDAGYTLRLYGQKGFDDPNEFLRHRLYIGVRGSVDAGIAKLYLRERAQYDLRTDSVNLDEKNRHNWVLRHRIGVDFTIKGKHIKPYAWFELVNTLNVPEYQKLYKNNDTNNKGTQYISNLRGAVGVKWQLNSRNSLNFYYRIDHDYNRDININRRFHNDKQQKIMLIEEHSLLHSIGITYEFDW